MFDLEKVRYPRLHVQEGYMLFRGAILMFRRVICCSEGLYANVHTEVVLAQAGNHG